jgi:hypothetical protein
VPCFFAACLADEQRHKGYQASHNEKPQVLSHLAEEFRPNAWRESIERQLFWCKKRSSEFRIDFAEPLLCTLGPLTISLDLG